MFLNSQKDSGSRRTESKVPLPEAIEGAKAAFVAAQKHYYNAREHGESDQLAQAHEYANTCRHLCNVNYKAETVEGLMYLQWLNVHDLGVTATPHGYPDDFCVDAMFALASIYYLSRRPFVSEEVEKLVLRLEKQIKVEQETAVTNVQKKYIGSLLKLDLGFVLTFGLAPLLGDPLTEEKAKDAFLKGKSMVEEAAKEGNHLAQMALYSLLHASPSKGDKKKAMEWLAKARDNNHSGARVLMDQITLVGASDAAQGQLKYPKESHGQGTIQCTLAEETILFIFSFLQVNDLGSVRLVCRQFNRLATDSQLFEAIERRRNKLYFRGFWRGARSTYRFKLHIDRIFLKEHSAEGYPVEAVSGELKWKLESTTLKWLRSKVGCVAKELLQGVYLSDIGLVALNGFAITDPSVIGHDRYRWIITNKGRNVDGITRSHGVLWNSRMDAEKDYYFDQTHSSKEWAW